MDPSPAEADGADLQRVVKPARDAYIERARIDEIVVDFAAIDRVS